MIYSYWMLQKANGKKEVSLFSFLMLEQSVLYEEKWNRFETFFTCYAYYLMLLKETQNEKTISLKFVFFLLEQTVGENRINRVDDKFEFGNKSK